MPCFTRLHQVKQHERREACGASSAGTSIATASAPPRRMRRISGRRGRAPLAPTSSLGAHLRQRRAQVVDEVDEIARRPATLLTSQEQVASV